MCKFYKLVNFPKEGNIFSFISSMKFRQNVDKSSKKP